MPAWRNWQTRWTQNPVPARACRFDPGRRYTRNDKVYWPCLFLFLDYLEQEVTKNFYKYQFIVHSCLVK